MSLVNTTGPAPAPPFNQALAGESNLGRILGVQTAVLALGLIVVSARVYARIFVVKAFGKDDACMVLAAICALGAWICFVIQGYYGLGKHQPTISVEEMVVFQHAGFWQSIIGACLALCFLKLSIGFGLLRLSKYKWFNWCIWATMALVVAYTIMAMMTFFFHCTPMAAHWDSRLVATSYCYPLPLFIKFALLNTGLNIATDVLFATYPIPIIWSLQMKRKVRIYLVVILSLGYFAVAFGILKAVYQIAFSSERDKTFNQWVQFWGYLQLNTGIIAACAATLKPLLNRFLGLGSTKDTGYYNQSASSGNRWTPHGPRSRADPREKLSSSDTHEEFEMGPTGLRGGTTTGGRSSAILDGTVANKGAGGLGPVEIKGGAGSGFYRVDEEAGSREMILGDGSRVPRRTDGIVVATEVKVNMRSR